MKVKQANLVPYSVEYIRYKKVDVDVFNGFFGAGRWFLYEDELNFIDIDQKLVYAYPGDYIVWDDMHEKFLVVQEGLFRVRYVKE